MRTTKGKTVKEAARREAIDGAAWLAVLIDARRKGDARGEAQARRELEGIGVRVAFADEGAPHAD